MRPELTLNVSAINGARTLAAIERAERLGLTGVWAPTMGPGPDALTSLAAAAARTSRVTLGTGVLPAFPRHPLVTAQQAVAIESLAPGRLRLGLGTSHAASMQGTFGIELRTPLRRLREYVTVVRTLLHDGKVDFQGQFYTAHAAIPKATGTPVLISALGPGAFRLAGEVTDGAVSWLCPAAYLESTALPAMQTGAQRAGRSRPRLVAGLPVAVCEEIEVVRAATRTQLANYVRAPYYQNMLIGSGLAEAAAGVWSDAMIDAVVIAGDEATVAARLDALGAAGIEEVAVTPILTGEDTRASMQRTLACLAALTRERG